MEAQRSGSSLLELLYFAGWRLKVHENETTTIRATRADVELESASDRPAAAAPILARAMRSSRRRKGAD
jgi:hypothetical protein